MNTFHCTGYLKHPSQKRRIDLFGNPSFLERIYKVASTLLLLEPLERILKNKRKWLISPVFFFASNYINASHHIAIEYRVRPGFRQKGHMAKCSSVCISYRTSYLKRADFNGSSKQYVRSSSPCSSSMLLLAESVPIPFVHLFPADLPRNVLFFPHFPAPIEPHRPLTLRR